MKETPAVQEEHAGASVANIIQMYKDTKIPRGYHQRRVFDLLSDGVPRSVADISVALRLSDPRSAIRDLRKRDIPIADEWCESVYGGRFKRYFIHSDNSRKEMCDE